MIDAFDGSGTVEPSPNPAQSEARAGTEDNAPSVIDRVREIAFDLFYEMDDLEGPNQEKFCSALAQALFDAGLLRTGRHAEVLRQLDRAESRYNTLREGLEGMWARYAAMRVSYHEDFCPVCVVSDCVATELRALLSKDGNE